MTVLHIRDSEVHLLELNPSGQQTIVLIHGLFSSLSVYYFSIAPRLAEKYRVLLYDLPGHGMSELGADGLNMPWLIDELFELMAACRAEQAYLVGYSFGGVVALLAAALHPERVNGLALIDAPLLDEPVFDRISSTEVDFAEALAEYSRSTKITLPDELATRAQQKIAGLMDSGVLADAVESARVMLDGARFEALATLAIPTLLLYAKSSPFLDSGRLLSQVLPRSAMKTRRGDHNLPVQHPKWITRRLRWFFK